MTIAVETNVELNLVGCSACGVIYGLPAVFEQARHDDKEDWHCPNGHVQHYPGKPVHDCLSDAKRDARLLREQLSQAREDVARKAKHITTLKRRAKRA